MGKFSIKNRRGLNMVVEVRIPEKPKGLSFTMYGLGGFKEQAHIQTLQNTFYDNNFISVTFDTTNSFGESEGDYIDATVEGYYQDFEDVIFWAQKGSWYQEPFFIAGHSLGGVWSSSFCADLYNYC